VGAAEAVDPLVAGEELAAELDDARRAAARAPHHQGEELGVRERAGAEREESLARSLRCGPAADRGHARHVEQRSCRGDFLCALGPPLRGLRTCVR